MALHYFHHSNGSTILDHFGTDLPDLTSVRREALRGMRELTNLGAGDSLWSGEPWKLWVTHDPDGIGPPILTLELNAPGSPTESAIGQSGTLQPDKT